MMYTSQHSSLHNDWNFFQCFGKWMLLSSGVGEKYSYSDGTVTE